MDDFLGVRALEGETSLLHEGQGGVDIEPYFLVQELSECVGRTVTPGDEAPNSAERVRRIELRP